MLTPLLKTLDTLLDKTVVGGYDRIGYHLRSALWEPGETDVDMTGKICLVTGANSGLGYETSLALARKNATVLLACRNPKRGQEALQTIREQSGNANVFLALVDMSDQSSIRDFVARFQSQYARLDVLINNAGALLNRRQESVDGIEMTLAANLLGPYLLTHLLLPLLKKSAPARVILVSSGGMYLAKLNLQDLQWQTRPYNGAMAYAETKRGLVILNQVWAKAYQNSGVSFYSMHPGWADTPGVQTALPGFRLATRLILRNNAEGADTMIWLAVNPRVQGDSGKFYCDRKARPIHRSAATRNSPSEIEAYWQILGDLTACSQAFPFKY